VLLGGSGEDDWRVAGGLSSGDVHTGQPGLVGVVAVDDDRTVAQECGDALLSGGVQIVVGNVVIDGSWGKYQRMIE